MSASRRPGFVFGMLSGVAAVALVLVMVVGNAGRSASSTAASEEAEGTGSPSAPASEVSPSEPATESGEGSLSPARGDGPLVSDLDLPVVAAITAAQSALEACREQGYNVSVAVVNRDDGLIKAHLRGDGTGPQTVESSRRKAYTAASLGRPTDELADRAFGGDPQTRGLPDLDDNVLFLGGGLPLIAQGQVIAGIGVGGAPGVEFDKACAQAGIEAIEDLLA